MINVLITGETCVYPIDGTVDPLTFDRLTAANVAAMGMSDWAALLFATCIAALAVVGELKVRRVLSFPLQDLVLSVPEQARAVQPRILHSAPLQLRAPGTG